MGFAISTTSSPEGDAEMALAVRKHGPVEFSLENGGGKERRHGYMDGFRGSRGLPCQDGYNGFLRGLAELKNYYTLTGSLSVGWILG